MTDPGDDGSEPASPSHAHTRAIITVEERVDHIAGMMERFEWERGKSGKVLAEQWGLSLSTVEGNAAEASRRVTGDKDEIARDITLTAKELLRSARLANDPRGAKAMMDALMDVSGARAPAKQELTGKDGERFNGPVIFVPPESDD